MYHIDIDDGYITRQFEYGTDDIPYQIESYVGGEVYQLIVDDDDDTPYVKSLKESSTIKPNYQTGDMDFGTDRYKRLERVSIRYQYSTSGSPTVSFKIGVDGGALTAVGTLAESNLLNTTVDFYPELYGRTFKFQILVETADVTVFEIDSFEIMGKVFRR